MQQDIINNYVMVDFYICAEKLNFDEINSLLDIYDSKVRKGNSFAYKEFAKDYWSIDTGYEVLEDIKIQIEQILNRLQNKIVVINKIKEKFKAECGFVITIKSGDNNLLYGIYYDRNFVNFVSMVGGDISMDFC